MKHTFRYAAWLAGSLLFPLFALGTLSGCGGGSANTPAKMPQELSGLDVIVSPDVRLSGEGVGNHGNFGEALVTATESKLIREGFDIVTPQQAGSAVRIQLQAHLEISRSQFLIVNGKPLESSSARVQVKILAPDGSLLDAFDAAGDPSDADTVAEVASQLVERMKGSRRLVALARAAPAAPVAVAAAPQSAKGFVGVSAEPAPASANQPPAKPSDWPNFSEPVEGQRDGERDVAVIVAIEDYADLSPIPGARINGEAWLQYLTDSRGLKRANVKMLLNKTARREQISKAVQEAAAIADGSGKLWFVFIGHGAPSRDQKGLLVGYDAEQTAEGIEDRSVKTDDLLAVMSSVSTTPVVVLDACFSGRSAGGDALVPGLMPSVVVSTSAPRGTLVLTGAQSNEFAGALPGGNRPAFSYLALGALRGWADQNRNRKVTATEVQQYVGDTLRVLLAGERQQTPTLEGERKDLELAIAAEKEPAAVRKMLAQSRAGR